MINSKIDKAQQTMLMIVPAVKSRKKIDQRKSIKSPRSTEWSKLKDVIYQLLQEAIVYTGRARPQIVETSRFKLERLVLVATVFMTGIARPA